MSTESPVSSDEFEEDAAEKAAEVIQSHRDDGITPDKETMFLSGALWAALDSGIFVDEDDAADEADSILEKASYGDDVAPTTLESMFLSGALWQKLVAEGRA